MYHLSLPPGDRERILLNLVHYSMKELEILASRAGQLGLRAHLKKQRGLDTMLFDNTCFCT